MRLIWSWGMRPPLSVSLEIGLLPRMRLGESRKAHRRVIDARDPLIGREIDFEELRRRHLRDEADIGDGRRIAVAKLAGGILVGEKLLHRLEPGVEPMLNPGE